jgi:hypothetical protein
MDVVAALFALLILAASATYVARALRAKQGSRARQRWQELADALEASLDQSDAKSTDLVLDGRTEGVEWTLRATEAADVPARLSATFMGIERLGTATVLRDAQVRESDGTGSELKTLYRVEAQPVAAGCIAWTEDQLTQELLLALAAPVVTVDSVLAVLLDQVDVERVSLAIELAARLSRLARDGIAASPPH